MHRSITRTVLLAVTLLAPAACRRSAPPSPAVTPAATAPRAPLTRLAVDEVMSRIERRENIAVYDNNSRARFDQGHLPGARWVAFNSVTQADLPANRETQLVFYCGGEQCMSCHTAAYQAQALGYTNVAIMPAGIRGWVAAGKPVETSTANAAPAAS